MKSKLLLLFFSLNVLNFCAAQDSTVVLNTSMFDANFQVIYLGAKDGWIFKEGNDTNWARKDISITGWKKFNPTRLSIKNANRDGRLEGWFRIRFILDSSFRNVPVGIQIGRWAAADVYIDGRHIISSGNTGLNGRPYEENRMNIEPAIAVNLVPGVEYILAFHLVDYRSPLKPSLLKTGMLNGGLGALVTITGRENLGKSIKYLKENSNYWTIWISVCSVLSLVFWFLYFQNRSEKNLLLISVCTTLFSIGMFCNATANIGIELPFTSWSGYLYAGDFFYGFSCATALLFLANAFRRKVSLPFVLFILLVALLSATSNFYFAGKSSALVGWALLFTCFYFIISSRKNLKGAQWAIVSGISLTQIWTILYVYNAAKYFPVFPFPLAYLYLTGLFLSFPLSLMVYVAMRFKEILLDVRLNAQQVLQLSEEKKEHAIQQQKMLEEEVARQTIELRTSFENLKSTQSQLIQSEKMASLGELTAGIAHEIQNPLNFVNNFSEVNKELIEELQEERNKISRDFKTEDDILIDIKDNEQKINHHGKRADAIVKGMLQHSRSSTGAKEPTNLNAIADEYLRLAYHGLRAKDNSFNVTMKTDFDESIGAINLIPQDIGRVLLNLYNNAFYAVNEKKKNPQPRPMVESKEYEPTVTVSTKSVKPPPGGGGLGVLISVKDNGNGISQKVIDKIFQPFFTTKPTGQGTGLGLSLSYDIVKAHGGEIKAKSEEGQGSIFSIQLPIT